MVLMDEQTFRQAFGDFGGSEGEHRGERPIERRKMGSQSRNKKCLYSTLNISQFKGVKDHVCYGCEAERKKDCKIGGEYGRFNY